MTSPETHFVKGHTGQVEFDGFVVRIIRKGGLARLSAGKGEKTIPVASITSIQWKPAGFAVNGYIQFVLPGAIEGKGGFGRQTTQAVRDDNSVLFTKAQMPQFEALRDAVQQAINERHAASAAPVVVQSAGRSTAEEIEHLAELRDRGILTQEEFEAQKSRLLEN